MIMGCSPNREALRAAIYYHTRVYVISSLLYTLLSSATGLNGNEAIFCHVVMEMKHEASDWSMLSRLVTR